MGKKALVGPSQGEIPRVPSISDTLTKFARALHDQSQIKDSMAIEDILKSQQRKTLGNVHRFDHNSLGGGNDEEDYNNSDENYKDGFKIVEEESKKAVEEMNKKKIKFSQSS